MAVQNKGTEAIISVVFYSVTFFYRDNTARSSTGTVRQRRNQKDENRTGRVSCLPAET